MIKLLIAEDEHLERKAIRFYLNKFYGDKIKIVEEVNNGKDAVSQSLKHNVDLVLMDIKMPKLSGLKAAEILKEKSPKTEIIILTAYSEFDYAVKSIQIGVIDYLVKPYVEKDFTKVIDKALEKINNKKTKINNEKKLLARLKNISPILEKEILLDLIYNTKSSTNNFIENKKLLGIQSNSYMFMNINYDHDQQIDELFYQQIRESLKDLFEGIIAYKGLLNSIFLLVDDQLIKKTNSEEYKNIINSISDKIKKDKSKMEIVESTIETDYHKLHEIYYQTKKTISDNQFSINKYPYQSEKKVFAKIIDKDFELAILEFNKIYNYLTKKEKANLKRIKSFLHRFLVFLNRRLMEYYNEANVFLNMPKIEKEVEIINNLERLKFYFEQIIQDLVENISNNAKEKQVEIIEMVKDYINQNYNEDISLDDVADYISFSKYYLSKLFKEVEGINYKNYLIKVRMEAAKRLLKKGEQIKVVSSEVGYSDRNYFSRSFKKYTGISPGKYQ